MMQLEPSKRISVKGALAHPFFAEYHSQNPMSSMVPAIQKQNSDDQEMSSDSDHTYNNM